MIEGLTKAANGEEQWTSPQRQTVDVGELIEMAVVQSQGAFEDKALELALELADDLPEIEADPDYLRRVVSSLLSNAYLASSDGGYIQVQAAQSHSSKVGRNPQDMNGDRFVIVSVKDSGGGLSDEALERVFDGGRPSQTPAGLGESGADLSMVRKLVEAHGGRLWVESESGVGSTFSFVLPIQARAGNALDRAG
jgi:signal transduction histidine kinase